MYVAEGDGDLVVAVEARDDEKLLRDLRRLRQRVELALLQPGRHEEVARALRGRLPEDRRLDVDEAGLLHDATDRADHAAAQPDIALQLRPAKIDPAVALAEGLVDVLLVEL